MQSIRSSIPRRALQLSAAARSTVAQRPLSSTSTLRSADSHGDHYNPPGGWLFGVKPGEQYQNEGWERVFYWGFFGSMAFGVVGYCYKPDTRSGFNTAIAIHREARNRLTPLTASRHGPSKRRGDGSRQRVSFRTLRRPNRYHDRALIHDKTFPRESEQPRSHDAARSSMLKKDAWA